VDMGAKKCGKCGITKPLALFSPQIQCIGGFRGTCKECASNFTKIWQKRKKSSLRGYLDSSLIAARHRAKIAGVPCTITIDYLMDLWETQEGLCSVSGLPFSFRKSKWFTNPYSPSIDRILPKYGYVENNVRFTLTAVNVSLNIWGLEELLPIFRAIISRSEKCKNN